MPKRLLITLAVACGALHCTGVSRAAEPSISFDTAGGEAWTFDKQVSGQIRRSACDKVIVSGPAGSTVAVVSGDRFWAQVPLSEGSNDLHASCRNKGREVARSDSQRWLARISDRPRANIRIRIDGSIILMDATGSDMAAGKAVPITAYEWRARAGNAAPLGLTSQSAPLDVTPAATQSIQVRAPDRDGEYYVTLRTTDLLGRSDESTAVFEVVDGAPREVDPARHRPKWIQHGVLYGVAPFAFGGNGYDDIRRRLPEIAALGATAIWLSPITAAAPEDFGYAVTDHFQPRPQFGSLLQLRALIEAAHARGMRVLMDFVPNHFATAHRYYADAERQERRSPYFGWFERDADGETTHYFDWTHLKNLEYDHPEVQRYMLEAFSYWVRELNIDGFRVDVSWGVRERAPEFWPRWRAELKRINPDILLIAESSARDGYYFQHGFDVAYDWTTKLGEWAWQDAFAEEGAPPDLNKLRAALISSTRDLPEPGIVLRFLNNNDTGERFITRHGVERTRVAAAMLFTLPGMPLVYNGDEVGAEFKPYDEEPISWQDRHGLVPYYSRLTELRKTVPALTSPAMEIISTDRDEAVLAYVRGGVEGGGGCADDNRALVLLNFSGEPVEVRLPSTAATAPFLEGSQWKDALSGEAIAAPRSAPVKLKAFDARVMVRDDSSC